MKKGGVFYSGIVAVGSSSGSCPEGRWFESTFRNEIYCTCKFCSLMSPGVAFLFFKMNISFNGSALSVKTGLCFLTLKQLGNALAPHRAYREEGSIPSEVTNRSYFYFVVVGYYLNGNGGRKKRTASFLFQKQEKK